MNPRGKTTATLSFKLSIDPTKDMIRVDNVYPVNRVSFRSRPLSSIVVATLSTLAKKNTLTDTRSVLYDPSTIVLPPELSTEPEDKMSSSKSFSISSYTVRVRSKSSTVPLPTLQDRFLIIVTTSLFSDRTPRINNSLFVPLVYSSFKMTIKSQIGDRIKE